MDNIDFTTGDEKNYFITAHICKYNIKKMCYKKAIFNYLRNAYGYYFSHNDWLSHLDILECLLGEKFFSYYSIEKFILNEDCIHDLFLDLDLEDLIATINLLSSCYTINNIDVSWIKPLCKKAIDNAISSYVENIDISDYCDNYDINDLIKQNTKTWFYKDDVEMDIDKDAATEELKKWVTEDIKNEILEKLSELDENIFTYKNISISEYVDTDGIQRVIDSYYEQGDYEHDDYRHSSSEEKYTSEIEAIFER